MKKRNMTLSPSRSERWMNCTGSSRMENDQPRSTSKWASEGTAAHELARRCLIKNVDSAAYLGTEITEDGEAFTVDTDMAEAVQLYLDTVRVEADRAGSQLFVEQSLDFSVFNDKLPDTAKFLFKQGLADAVTWQDTTRFLQVFDLKYGQGVVVDPTENSQLMMYVLGAVLALKKKPAAIRAHIIQPRASHPDGPVRTYYFTYEKLVEFRNELVQRAIDTNAPDAPLNPGEWCRFCAAQAVCPAQYAYMQRLASDDFSDTTSPNLPVLASQPALRPVDPPLPGTLDFETLSYILTQAPVVEAWLKSVRAYVADQIRSGREIPGWKIVAKRATRKWLSEQDAEAWMREVGIADPHTKKLLSPAQTEGEIKRLYPRGSRPGLPGNLVTSESSGGRLAPASDPAPALPVSPEDDFEADMKTLEEE